MQSGDPGIDVLTFVDAIGVSWHRWGWGPAFFLLLALSSVQEGHFATDCGQSR